MDKGRLVCLRTQAQRAIHGYEVSSNNLCVEYKCPRTQEPGYVKISEITRTHKASRKQEQGRAQTLPELLALAKKRGYKPGWAYKIFYGRKS